MKVQRISRATVAACLAGLGICLPTDAAAYTLWQYGAGRADYASQYDLAGYMWPSAGGAAIYDFGAIGTFSALPPGVDPTWLEASVTNAGEAWEAWANVSFGDTLGTTGTGKVRLATANIGNTPAETAPTLNGNLMDYATITFTDQLNWTKESFLGVLTHELGHVLGLGDLYDFASKTPPSMAEEFVDHPVAGTDLPDRRPEARQDNMMAGDIWWYNDPRVIVDNDEIAAVTWLWDGPYNQIVTGDLGAFNPAYFNFRDTDPHHGDDANNGGLGWWDYRGSITTAPTSGLPYIDLLFAGYQEFIGNAFPYVSWDHMDLGNDIHRFILEDANWTGNFDLWVRSSTSQERRIDAWVGGGGVDQFNLPANTNGLVFKEGIRFAQVFGPVPSPSPLVLIGAGLIGLGLSRLVMSRTGTHAGLSRRQGRPTR